MGHSGSGPALRPRFWGILLLGLALLASCAGPQASPPPFGTRVVPSGSADLAVLAISDLARRLEVHASRVSIAKVEPIDWPDASLGCPQPDMAYAQVVTPGYRILLSAKAQIYEYHSDRGSRVILCSPTPQGQP